MTQRIQAIVIGTPGFLKKHKYHVAAVLLISLWCYPYFTTGSRLELGDFSFFAQAYEAMRISITQFHQFPWFNPWVSGGVPLYGNPQMGLFSIQMLLVLAFGAPIGLKLAVVIYTFAGYASMYLLLRKYFKINPLLSTMLSLIWIFTSFFVSHLPAHFTFVWYMLAPLYIYLALTIKNWKGGLLFGVAFAVMALSQIHNAFMHLSLICGIILACRLLFEKVNRKQILIALGLAGLAFVLLAGHRFLFTYQNVHDFPHEVVDVVPHPAAALLGILLPLSLARPLQFFHYPPHPYVPHGFHEATATIGICALFVAFLSVLFIGYAFYSGGRHKLRTALIEYRKPLIVLGVSLLCFTTALGAFATFAPYNILKHLPVFSEMRVCTRWFIFFDLALLCFIGLMINNAKKSFFRFVGYTLLGLGVIELMVLNVGYQSNILRREPVLAPKAISQYPFAQTSYFGETHKLPNGDTLPDDGNMPAMYREFEAMSYNMGILYANDALVQLHLDPRRNPGHPTCPYEEGCSFVRSGNAKVTFWSPGKIVLKRTGPGSILLNMNNSNYFVVNGKRNANIKVAEPFTDFAINEPDTTTTISIEVRPSLGTLLK